MNISIVHGIFALNFGSRYFAHDFLFPIFLCSEWKTYFTNDQYDS